MTNLSRRGFFWIVAVVLFVEASALGLAGVQLARLSQDAAMERQHVVLADLVRRLDGKAASVRTLELVVDGAIPRLPPDLTATVIDARGLIVASSAASDRWDGDPAPAGWLGQNGAIRTGEWSGTERVGGDRRGTAAGAVIGDDTLIAGAPLLDRSGRLIGAVVVEDSGTATPLMIGTLMPALLWGNLLLAALLPACWFGAGLAVAPVGAQALAATGVLGALGMDGGVPSSGRNAKEAGDEFLAFGRVGRTLLEEFDAAVEAVSIAGDEGAAPGVAS